LKKLARSNRWFVSGLFVAHRDVIAMSESKLPW